MYLKGMCVEADFFFFVLGLCHMFGFWNIYFGDNVTEIRCFIFLFSTKGELFYGIEL